jgi:uncharacterized membrane protein
MTDPSPPSLPPASPLSADGGPAPKPRKQRRPLRERSPILAHLRSVLFAGFLTSIPIFITLYIVSFIYGLITQPTKNFAAWIVTRLFGDTSDGYVVFLRTATTAAFAVVIALAIVYILGLLGTFLVGRQILAQLEHFIENLPLIKGIYGTIKQVIAVFRKGGGGSGFQRVVLVEFPRLGTWTVAFVTNTVHDSAHGNLVCCFIPMTPNPTSGFFQMFPENQVRNTDWSVDLGIKIVLSGGLLAPHELHSQAPTSSPEPGTATPKPAD